MTEDERNISAFQTMLKNSSQSLEDLPADIQGLVLGYARVTLEYLKPIAVSVKRLGGTAVYKSPGRWVLDCPEPPCRVYLSDDDKDPTLIDVALVG